MDDQQKTNSVIAHLITRGFDVLEVQAGARASIVVSDKGLRAWINATTFCVNSSEMPEETHEELAEAVEFAARYDCRGL